MADRTEKGLTRRRFLERAGQGLAVASAFGTMARRAFAQQVPEPPGRKLGWAIVGLGNLAINQILPAFAKSEKSKVVALVSGHPDKAAKLAARYGVSPKAIYNYQNYDTLKDNRKSTSSTSSCPTACTRSTRSAPTRRANTSSPRSRWRTRPPIARP